MRWLIPVQVPLTPWAASEALRSCCALTPGVVSGPPQGSWRDRPYPQYAHAGPSPSLQGIRTGLFFDDNTWKLTPSPRGRASLRPSHACAIARDCCPAEFRSASAPHPLPSCPAFPVPPGPAGPPPGLFRSLLPPPATAGPPGRSIPLSRRRTRRGWRRSRRWPPGFPRHPGQCAVKLFGFKKLVPNIPAAVKAPKTPRRGGDARGIQRHPSQDNVVFLDSTAAPQYRVRRN